MKNKLKLAFSDMWGFEDYLFNPQDNYFTDLLGTKFNIEINQEKPDLLIYSVFGNTYKNYKCKKILFSGENLDAGKGQLSHYDDSDVTLSHYEDLPKEIFMPLWVLFVNWFNKKQPRPLPSNPTYSVGLDAIQNNRERFLKDRKFCAFINNNPIEDRIKLFHGLSDIACLTSCDGSRLPDFKEQVDSFGSLFNNTGSALRGSQYDKVKLLERYKFTIAFENSYHPGYNTEKIIEPLESGCIPLYNGGERVRDYFNPKSFLYYKDYTSTDKYISAVLHICQNKDLYESIVLQAPLNLDKIEKDLSPTIILNKVLNLLNL